MAAGTNNVFVNAFERETGALVVVKERRSPLGRVVTFCARGRARFGELLAMNVLVTLLTLPGRRFEIHVNQGGFKIWRFVAIDTRRSSMRSQQGERGFRVIELRQLFP